MSEGELGQTRGTLILVVGPSGAGKDTLIAGARERLKNDPRLVFPRRVITRAADAGGEDHIAVDAATFERMHREGAFSLSWSAHGFSYGVPKSIAGDLATGRHVVVNVSRSILEEATKKYPPAGIILISAPADVLAKRLAARGRETPEEVLQRLNSIWSPEHLVLRAPTIENAGSPEAAIDRFVAYLRKQNRIRSY